MSAIHILGIETSCDETAACVVKDGCKPLSDVVFSQTPIHKKYGGVVPEIASRNHLDKISLCVDKAMTAAGLTFDNINAVAVTYAPGLVGALLTGLAYAKGLAYAIKKPLIGVNHIEGHICANYIDNPNLKPPFLCLVASGGHTSLYAVKSFDEYELIGRTLDDAAGEAFDKTARALSLGYPGGAAIETAAKTGDVSAITFPRAININNNYDFSFSGLKSAVLNYINQHRESGFCVPDVAASFQQALIDSLVTKTIAAAIAFKIKDVAIAGGVSANTALRKELQNACDNNNLSLYIPKPAHCTDNAVMIAARGYFDYLSGNFSPLSLNARSKV